jgi:hypothetical protein
MIEVRVRFWTDSIVPGKGKIRAKHALTSGVVDMARSDVHGITPSNPRPFNSLGDLGAKIETVLIEAGVKLHPDGRTRKLLASD